VDLRINNLAPLQSSQQGLLQIYGCGEDNFGSDGCRKLLKTVT